MRADINNDGRELFWLKIKLATLRDVAEEYHGRTIENIISNIEARIKVKEQEQ